MSLIKIQQELKAPKNQFNAFAKYKYRSAEDIIEAAKPICHKYGYALMLSDEVVEVGGRVYVKATACLSNGEDNITCTGLAREEENKNENPTKEQLQKQLEMIETFNKELSIITSTKFLIFAKPGKKEIIKNNRNRRFHLLCVCVCSC